MIKYLLLSIVTFFSTFSFAQEDTVLYQYDSVIEVDEQDCALRFFETNPTVESPRKAILTFTNGKFSSLATFQNTVNMKDHSKHVMADLDKDGRNELLIMNYTGGAHCCDEVYVFRNTAPNKYKQVSKFFAGNTCITDSNSFIFNFYEPFGYFFSCYACSYPVETDEAPAPLRSIELVYKNGKMQVVQGDKDLRNTIIDNLAKLAEEPYQKLDETDFDNGLRKEFALNLAVHYYSFGRNLAETQKLFNKYYKYPDAKKVWAEWIRVIGFVKKQNLF